MHPDTLYHLVKQLLAARHAEADRQRRWRQAVGPHRPWRNGRRWLGTVLIRLGERLAPCETLGGDPLLRR